MGKRASAEVVRYRAELVGATVLLTTDWVEAEDRVREALVRVLSRRRGDITAVCREIAAACREESASAWGERARLVSTDGGARSAENNVVGDVDLRDLLGRLDRPDRAALMLSHRGLDAVAAELRLDVAHAWTRAAEFLPTGTDLAGMLSEFVSRQTRCAARRDAGSEDDLTPRIRRRRWARALAVGSSATAVVALAAGVLWWVSQPGTAPGPSASVVAADLELPTGGPLQLDAVGPGWSLVQYEIVCEDSCVLPSDARRTYLVSPTGELSAITVGPGMDLMDWWPADSVGLFRDGDEFVTARLDTGEAVHSPIPAGAEWATAWFTESGVVVTAPPRPGDLRSRLEWWSRDGSLESVHETAADPELIWNADRSAVLEAGSGGPLVRRMPGMEALSTAAALPEDVVECVGLGWSAPEEVMVNCLGLAPPDEAGVSYLSSGSIWRVPLDGSANEVGFYRDDWSSAIDRTWAVGDRVVAVTQWSGVGEPAPPRLLEINAAGEFVDLGTAESLQIHGAFERGLLVTSEKMALGWFDPFTGVSTVLIEGPGAGYTAAVRAQLAPGR